MIDSINEPIDFKKIIEEMYTDFAYYVEKICPRENTRFSRFAVICFRKFNRNQLLTLQNDCSLTGSEEDIIGRIQHWTLQFEYCILRRKALVETTK